MIIEGNKSVATKVGRRRRRLERVGLKDGASGLLTTIPEDGITKPGTH